MKSNEYLSFTKRERNGILSLVVILIGVMVLSRYCRREPEITNAMLHANMDTTIQDQREKFIQQNPSQPAHELRSRAKSPPRSYVRKEYKPVEINSADTSELIALPGIGSKLAARIVLFREKLGGFCSVRQVGEVYGLQDSVFQKLVAYLRCDSQKIKKIDINNATKEQLAAHPYIRWKMADAIITYRNEHVSFMTANELQKIEVIDEEACRRLLPYIDCR
jgi:competence ComEA-like helix-hairpin-helix protein